MFILQIELQPCCNQTKYISMHVDYIAIFLYNLYFFLDTTLFVWLQHLTEIVL